MANPFSSGHFSETQFSTQPETLAVPMKKSKLYIGIPKEFSFQENRVALVPATVAALCKSGHRVVVERGAGEKSHFSDLDYTEAGAEILDDKKAVFEAEMIIKISPMLESEVELLHTNQVLITPLHLPTITAKFLSELRKKRVIALAMEYIKDESDSFPIVRILSEIAGYNSILTAAELMSSNNGPGVLLGGISGVAPAQVVILGAGIVGEFAARAALGLGAEVKVFDDNIKKLMRLQNNIGRRIFTSVLNPGILKDALLQADAAIGAHHSKEGGSQLLVDEEVVMAMRQGSVIIDISIDQGGCFATSEITSHKEPTFVKHGVVHYCVPNIASRVGRTASIACSNILGSILFRAAKYGQFDYLLYNKEGIRNGVYMYKGCLTNEYLGNRFDMKSMNLDLLLTSQI